ncbi:hypothetical protein AYO40_03215 [Planctomycetaceae bacterium SCGC AG-212-D15]|nr:hypothetical protein AYO40_03215 [Planctomycetaceae bacterium SCGC AG-212-D15]
MVRAILAVLVAMAAFLVPIAVEMAIMLSKLTPEQLQAMRQGQPPPTGNVTVAHFVSAYAYRYVAGFVGGFLAAQIARSMVPCLVALSLIMLIEFGGVWKLRNLVPVWWLAIAYPLLAVAIVAGIFVRRPRSVPAVAS